MTTARLPSGTIAFLFSDIEGSTKRWESHAGAMEHSVRRHDHLIRAAIEAHNGHVFKTIGDAFCAAFNVVPDAVDAALSAQRALAEESWSDIGGMAVRMAIHAGLADERDGDYFGSTVNRVARLLAVAHGGQVVLSGAAAGLFKDATMPHVMLRELGRHRLRDLAQPETVFQLVAPGLRDEFPPLQSIDAQPNNLPLQLTTFVGRDDEVEAIAKMLTDARLVTVVGAGGIGKTRACLQVAADVLASVPDGAWFVDLAPVADASLVGGALAAALGVGESPGRSALDAVIEHLRPRKALIVLDNCEHVIAEAAQLADAILRRCPGVSLLATSRESLSIGGEHVYRMPSLSVPRAGDAPTADRALAFGAISLFVDRAKAADARFALTDENVGVVADICRRLDGIALAIELAASRVKTFSVRQLAERLDERFRLLTGGSRAALPRQQTMRALIDWSYDLLAEVDRATFRMLGCFSGGWTLEAAVAVCGRGRESEWEVLDQVSALADKSLLQVDVEHDVPRYKLLESTRQYARDALESAGEAESTTRAHCAYFLELARRADALFVGEGRSDEANELLESEVDNFRAALVWALNEKHEPQIGGEIAARLSLLWARSLRYEGARWLNAARASATDNALMARVLLGLAQTLPDGNEKVARAREAAAAYRGLDDPLGLASAVSMQAEAERAIGDYQAASESQDEGVRLYRAHGAPAQLASALLTLSSVETVEGNRQSARDHLEEALRLNPRNGSAALNLAELEFADGRYASSIELGRKGLEYFRSRHRTNACIALCNLAAYSLALELADDARGFAREALEVATSLHLPDLTALSVQHLASVAVLLGDGDRAALLLGYVDARYAIAGLKRDTSEQVTYERLRQGLEQSLDDATLRSRLAAGAALSDDESVAEARRV